MILLSTLQLVPYKLRLLAHESFMVQKQVIYQTRKMVNPPLFQTDRIVSPRSGYFELPNFWGAETFLK